VRKADVAAAAPAPVTPSTLPQPPLVSGPRAVIARRMSESAFTAPHVTPFTEADATALVEARRQLNAELTGGRKSPTTPCSWRWWPGCCRSIRR
jgi:pyruvate/2-oxoglutarate dehydrogenase complex dihydrolipoamide acyltransferase (E2) component